MSEEKKSVTELIALQDAPPSQADIDNWKVKYGDVYTSAFSETEVYIWRSLMRPEFVDLQTRAGTEQWTQTKIEESTCALCVLWPVKNWSTVKAGTPSTLSEQIMQNSNFLAPHVAAQFVAKL